MQTPHAARSALRQDAQDQVDDDGADDTEAEQFGECVRTNKFQHDLCKCNSRASIRRAIWEAGWPF